MDSVCVPMRCGIDPVTNKLPAFLLTHGNEENWFHNQDEVERFLNENKLTLDEEQDEEEVAGQDESSLENLAHLAEMHEVRTINSGLQDLQPLGFGIDDLIPVERTGSTAARFELIRGEDTRRPLNDLRDLLPEVRAAGEKGLQVTRFKGLGEMNAEELRETTLDPANRTLLKVNLTDAGTADEMFRLLMGDKVEPRREFIEKHALDARNLDV